MKLNKKKAIVTGANRSIGRAIAVAFAKEGAEVFISYRSDEKGARETVRQMGGGKALYADFSHVQHVENFFEEALKFLGRVDILVNNAAGYDTSSFLELPLETFEHLLKVGVSMPMLLIQLAARSMIHQKIAGSIINVSSISGNRPYPNRVAHATAKAALNMLTQNTALDLAPYKIRVNGIAPGPVPYDEDSATVPVSEIPLGRVGKPEDQAHAAVFLASQASSWMTGQILTIDGGRSLSF